MLVSVVTPFYHPRPDDPAVRDALAAWLANLRAQAAPLEPILAATAPRRSSPYEALLADLEPAGWARQVYAPYDAARQAPQSRAGAILAGADVASGEVIVMLHADCRLPSGAVEAIRAARRAGYLGGAFTKRYDSDSPLLRLQEWWLNDWRLRRLGQGVGTNALWLARELWAERPVPDLPLLEDVACGAWMARRLGRAGVHVAPAPVLVSADKYQRTGPAASMVINFLVLVLHRLGVPPAVLRDELYSRERLAVGTARLWPSIAAAAWRAARRGWT